MKKDRSQREFSDARGDFPAGGIVRAGGRALPAVVMVFLAIVASARAAETFGPVGRSVASEVAAVRLLSDAIVRAVRNLSDQDGRAPAAMPDAFDAVAPLVPVCQESPPTPSSAHGWLATLGWHRLDRPPPAM